MGRIALHAMACALVFLSLLGTVLAEPKPPVPATAGTDVVELKCGDRLTGTVVKLEGGKLIFKTAYAADPISIAWDQVVKLSVTKPMVLGAGKSTLKVSALKNAGKTVEAATPSGSKAVAAAEVKTLRTPADEATYLKSLHPDWGHAWTINAHANFTLVKGNADTESFGVGASGIRSTSKDKTTINFSSLFSRNNANNSTTANTTDGNARFDRNVHPKVFVFGSGEFLNNGLQNLDLRSILSSGLGWHAVKTKTQTLDGFCGATWTRESYSATSSSAAVVNSFAALNAGETYSAKLGKSSNLTEQSNFYPSMNTTGGYQFVITSGLTTRLVKLLSWNVNFSDTYTSFPPSGTKNNDTVFTTGVGLALARP